MLDRKLLGVFVRVGERGIGRREPVRVDLAAPIARFLRRLQRHVAIRTGLALGRIVERSRAFAESRGLPVVVIVKAAEPAIVVDRNVEVNFVARGAEFGRLLRHERLHESLAVRLRIQIGHEVDHGADHFVLAGHQLMQRRVLDGESVIAHGAVHADDGMATGAGQAPREPPAYRSAS